MDQGGIDEKQRSKVDAFWEEAEKRVGEGWASSRVRLKIVSQMGLCKEVLVGGKGVDMSIVVAGSLIVNLPSANTWKVNIPRDNEVDLRRRGRYLVEDLKALPLDKVHVVVGDLVVVDRQELRGETAKTERDENNASLGERGDLEVGSGETFGDQNEHAASGTIFPLIMISIMPVLQRLPKNLHFRRSPMTFRNDCNSLRS